MLMCQRQQPMSKIFRHGHTRFLQFLIDIFVIKRLEVMGKHKNDFFFHLKWHFLEGKSISHFFVEDYLFRPFWGYFSQNV